MGFIGFIVAGGGSIGVFLGGVLTDALDWHWIVLVNIPIGAMAIVLCVVLIPVGAGQRGSRRLDVAGSVTVTMALMIAVYAIIDGNHVGWASGWTIGLLGLAVVLLAVFVRIESRAHSPLMPLALFRLRGVAAANIVGVLWAAALYVWFFLPANLIMGVFSLGLSERIVMRWGIRAPLVIGMLLVGASLALFARAPVGGNFAVDVLPGMILLGLGMGTSFMMGGALGLAVLASFADARSRGLTSAGVGRLAALTGGYHAAFVVAAVCAATAAVVGALRLRSGDAPTPHEDREVLSAHAAVN